MLHHFQDLFFADKLDQMAQLISLMYSIAFARAASLFAIYRYSWS
jgi:hypothetical protein